VTAYYPYLPSEEDRPNRRGFLLILGGLLILGAIVSRNPERRSPRPVPVAPTPRPEPEPDPNCPDGRCPLRPTPKPLRPR
jgi:hypothetical protein